MDKRKTYYICLDTETCNGQTRVNEKGKTILELQDSLVYDIGWAVIDKKGNVYESRSFVVNEIFYGEQELMKSAYYADKLPKYHEDIMNGLRIAMDLYDIRQILCKDMEKYGVNIIMAHYAQFDVNALNTTERYLTKSKYRYFFPKGTEIWDTLKMAHDTIGQQKTYRKFCEDNSFMTAHCTPRPRLTAEVLYRYIIHDIEFTEKHTGLEDVMIEKEIFVKCTAQHKKMRRKLYEDEAE